MKTVNQRQLRLQMVEGESEIARARRLLEPQLNSASRQKHSCQVYERRDW